MPSESSDTPPNMLYLFLDELRADALGCYGHPFVETPNIDALAEQGVLFEQSLTNNPICTPARTSLMSSLYPHQTGVSWVHRSPLDGLEDRFEFHDVMRDVGYDRIVNVGKYHIPDISPSDAGFDQHVPVNDALGANPARPPHGLSEDDVIRIPGTPNTILSGVHPNARATETHRIVDETIDQIEAQPDDDPWFVRMSLNRPHTPVLPPEPYASLYADEVGLPVGGGDELADRVPVLSQWRQHRGFDRFTDKELRLIRQHYYGLVSFIDDQIGRLFDHLREQGAFEDTLVVFIADHGSSIGDHDMQVKGPYDSGDITEVPMIFAWPGEIDEGERYEGLSQLIDVHPTLIDLLGGEIPDYYEGESLRPALHGNHDPIHEEVFIEGTWREQYPGYRQTVRTTDWRYTRYPALGQRELINLDADPDETTDVSDRYPAIVEDFDERIENWVEATPPITVNTEPEWTIDD